MIYKSFLLWNTEERRILGNASLGVPVLFSPLHRQAVFNCCSTKQNRVPEKEMPNRSTTPPDKWEEAYHKACTTHLQGIVRGVLHKGNTPSLKNMRITHDVLYYARLCCLSETNPDFWVTKGTPSGDSSVRPENWVPLIANPEQGDDLLCDIRANMAERLLEGMDVLKKAIEDMTLLKQMAARLSAYDFEEEDTDAPE